MSWPSEYEHGLRCFDIAAMAVSALAGGGRWAWTHIRVEHVEGEYLPTSTICWDGRVIHRQHWVRVSEYGWRLHQEWCPEVACE